MICTLRRYLRTIHTRFDILDTKGDFAVVAKANALFEAQVLVFMIENMSQPHYILGGWTQERPARLPPAFDYMSLRAFPETTTFPLTAEHDAFQSLVEMERPWSIVCANDGRAWRVGFETVADAVEFKLRLP